MKRGRSPVATLETAVRALHGELQALGTEERRLWDRQYLRMDTISGLQGVGNLGVTSPHVASVAKRWAKEHLSTAEDVASASALLWSGLPDPVYDLRLACVKILRQFAKRLPAAFLVSVEAFLDTAHTWALVDELAMHVASELVAKQPDPVAVLERWATHDNFWLRRSCLLALSPPIKAGQGDFALFARFAETMLDEKEFFIRKAIGWVLRDASRKRPALVSEWCQQHAPRLSTVTAREAVKYLPAKDAALINTLRKQ